MKIRSLLTWFSLVIFLTAAPAIALSQDVFDPGSGWVDKDDPRYYEQQFDEYRQKIDQARWAELFTHLRIESEEALTEWGDARVVHERLLDALERTIDELMKIEVLHDGNYTENLDRLNTGRFAEGVAGDGFVAFNGIDGMLVLCMEGYESLVPCDSPEHPALTEEQAKEIRYRANTANEILVLIRADADERISGAIADSHRKWRNFIDRGFVMYPWESRLNSRLLNWDIRSPPTRQYIFMHPSLGIQMPFEGFRDAADLRVKESLMIEVAGHLWYRGEYLHNYYGLSATVILREDIPPGIGGLVRAGRGMAAGVNWHLSPNDGSTFQNSPYLSISVDLLSLLSSNRGVIRL